MQRLMHNFELCAIMRQPNHHFIVGLSLYKTTAKPLKTIYCVCADVHELQQQNLTRVALNLLLKTSLQPLGVSVQVCNHTRRPRPEEFSGFKTTALQKWTSAQRKGKTQHKIVIFKNPNGEKFLSSSLIGQELSLSRILPLIGLGPKALSNKSRGASDFPLSHYGLRQGADCL